MTCQRCRSYTRFLVSAFGGAVVALAWLASPSAAQPMIGPGSPSPRVFIAMPPGGKAGTTVEVTLSGVDLDEPQGLLFDVSGIKATLVGAATPPPPAEPRRRGGRQPMVAATNAVKFKVTIPADAPLGLHDVRLVNKHGVSNPRAFVVGDLTEFIEKEPNNDVEQAQRVEVNSTVNGVIGAPTDVDYYVFAGKKGQRVVVSCLSSSIDSRLYTGMELYDAAGKLLGANRHYNGTDALVDCILPADGDYNVRLFNYTYTRGGPEYFYRLSISTAPWIDAIFPSVVEPGKPAKVTVYGRNLPGGKPDPAAVCDGQVLEKVTVNVNVPNDPVSLQRLAYSGHIPPGSSDLDGFEFRLRNDSGTSNPYLLTYAQAPVVLDNEKNDTAADAQEVPVPCEIAGRVEKRRDRDWYEFSARKGDVYSIELYSDRLGSADDMYFVLRRRSNKQTIGEFDDSQETLHPSQFFTRTTDPPRYRFVVPADDKYQLLVASREADNVADPRDLYRVRITPEQPDFRLVVMPPAQNFPDGTVAQQGGQQYYTVFAWRRDAWNGEITLSAEGLPKGVTCKPQVIGPGMKQAALVVSATPDAPIWTGEIKVRGTASINGKTVVREARPATITWPVFQQNFPTVGRLDRNLVLAVRDKAPFRLIAGIEEVTGAPGTRVTVPLKLERLTLDPKTQLQVLPVVLPPNVNVAPAVIASGKNDGSIVLDIRSGTPPGTYTVVFRGLAPPTGRSAQQGRRFTNLVAQPSTPVTLTIMPKQLANVSVSPASAKVKPGSETELVVRINRLNDYAGEFQVQLVLPSKIEGIEAEEITIPAGKNEAKLLLRVDESVEPGNRTNLIVRATGKFNGKAAISQDAKFSLNVVK